MLQNICDEFVCALRKRVLLQGRLYICEHFICFHSNLFGYSKEKVIPLKVVQTSSILTLKTACCLAHEHVQSPVVLTHAKQLALLDSGRHMGMQHRSRVVHA